MTDPLDRFLQDLHFDVPAGLVERAKRAAATRDQSGLAVTPRQVRSELDVRPEQHITPPLQKTGFGVDSRETGRQRLPKLLALAAALLALTIVVTLMLTARSLHPRQIVPANPVVPLSPTPYPPPVPQTGSLYPGSYHFANPNADSTGYCVSACSGYRQVIFTLPADGWASKNGLVYKHLGQSDEVAFSLWAVRDVYDDPCHWQRSALSPLDITHQTAVVNGVIVLAPYVGGLANQTLRGPIPRAITPVTFASVWGGSTDHVTALRIDLSVPTELDISTCDKGQFRSWPVAYNGTEVNNAASLADDSANFHHVSGQLDSIYMVNVDRWPLVIDASHMPASSLTDLAELKSIVASMVIDRG
jgi:hypothetical protein